MSVKSCFMLSNFLSEMKTVLFCDNHFELKPWLWCQFSMY